MTNRQRYNLLRNYLLVLVTLAFAMLLGWMTQEHEIVLLIILQQVAFLSWTSFTAWYGVRRKWEATPEGVNVFIVSLGIWMLLLLVEASIFWPDAAWRPWLRVAIFLLLSTGGLQRLWFLSHESKITAPGRGDE